MDDPTGKHRIWLTTLAAIVAGAGVFGYPEVAAAQDMVRVEAVVDDQEVYLGASFFYQVHVTGGRQVEEPELSGFEDFDVRQIPESWIRYRSGSQWDRFLREEGTSYLYRLVALRPGAVSIPSVTLRVDGRTYRAPSVSLSVIMPPPSDQFRLVLSLSQAEVYVGEPFELTAVWYYSTVPRYYYANIPLLSHPAFDGASGAAGSGLGVRARSMVNAGSWTGRQGSAVLEGIQYSTVTFRQVVFPREPGRFDFPPNTVQVWVPREQGSAGNPGERWNFDSAVVAAPGQSIRVRPLPLEGRPGDFSGIVARDLRVRAEVAPSVMNVGDPVSLSVTLSGPPALEAAELPPLGALADLLRDFTVSSDPPAVRIREGEKTFTQTVRVRREDIREVPPLEISFFNTRTGAYDSARSRPFAITVRPTRIVTSQDLFGEEPPGVSRAGVRSFSDGILHNYGSSGRLLRSAPYRAFALARRPGALSLLIVPVLLLAAAVVLAYRRPPAIRAAAAAAVSAEQLGGPAPEQTAPPAGLPVWPGSGGSPALQRLALRLARIESEGNGAPADVLTAWREYLGERLRLPPGRLTAEDLGTELRLRQVDPELLGRVRELFAEYESAVYRGGSGGPSRLEGLRRVSEELEAGLNTP